jgi:hypothetical protein
MKMWWLLLLAPVAATAAAGGAQACTSGIMKSYFSYQRPVRQGGMTMLRVRVDDVDVDGPVVSARLDGAFAHLSADGRVRILLPDYPFGSNCILMGPTDGPVFVIGRLSQTSPGQLSLVATPTRDLPRRRRSRCEIEQYIVDPAYLPPAPRRCARETP